MQPPAALHVLLIDDDALVRWAIGSMLIQHGCTFVECQDCRSAIRTVADLTNRFDVILLGFPLPDALGLEIVTTLKQLAPQSRMVLMSCDLSAEDQAEGGRRGACAFVAKPFDLDDVWMLIRENRCPRAVARSRIFLK